MEYKFFDKKYLVMPDDTGIIGKRVFYADHFDTLIIDVESGNASRTGMLDGIITNCAFPFYINDSRWSLCYYDPAYEAKAAYSQGRTIEYRRKGTDEWHISTGGVVDEEHYDYRVKPDAPVHEYKYVPYDSVSEMMYDHFNVDCIEDIKNCIWLRSKADTSIRFMVTGIGINQVMVASVWLNPSQLLDDYLWEDYTAIGK